MIRIRDYAERDAEALRSLFFNTVRTINRRDYTEAQVRAWASNACDVEYWTRRMSGLSPFVAEIDGVIVGYTDLQDDGLIDHFFCHHEYQRRGVGRALMTHVLKLGASRGVDRFHSEVSITARPFYERFGFHVVGEKSETGDGQTLTYHLMEKVA